MMRFALHAVERYVERHAPHLTIEEAQRQLEESWSSAIRMRDRTHLGHEQWLLRSLDVILVVKRDDRGPIAVTTIPAPPKTHGEKLAEELAEAEADRVARLNLARLRGKRQARAGLPDPGAAAQSEAAEVQEGLPKSQAAWTNYARGLRDENRSLRERTQRMVATIEECHAVQSKTNHALRIALRTLLRLSPGDGDVAECLRQIEALVPRATSRVFLEPDSQKHAAALGAKETSSG